MNPQSPVIPDPNNKFGDFEIKIAEHQEEYNTLPSVPLEEGHIMITRWAMTDEEKEEFLKNGYFFLYTYTFGRPFSPVILSTSLVNLPTGKSMRASIHKRKYQGFLKMYAAIAEHITALNESDEEPNQDAVEQNMLNLFMKLSREIEI